MAKQVLNKPKRITFVLPIVNVIFGAASAAVQKHMMMIISYFAVFVFFQKINWHVTEREHFIQIAIC